MSLASYLFSTLHASARNRTLTAGFGGRCSSIELRKQRPREDSNLQLTQVRSLALCPLSYAGNALGRTRTFYSRLRKPVPLLWSIESIEVAGQSRTGTERGCSSLPLQADCYAKSR